MNPNQSSRGNLLSGVLGSLVKAIVFGVLLATGVIDTGKTETKVVNHTTPIGVQPSNDVEQGGQTKTVQQVYEEDGPGGAFIQSQEGAAGGCGEASGSG